MSIVGTRPPTLDEWNKYELHHRARLAIKPGITGIHYAMPVRNMIYDALQYGKQVADTAANHRKNDKSFRKRTSGEYLSGFYKEDVLKPVVTLGRVTKAIVRRI